MKKCVEELAEYIGKNIVVGVGRKRIEKLLLNGFVVGVSEKLVLLHVVNGSTLTLNGYSAIRVYDMRSFQVDGSIFTRALEALGRKPTIPEGIDCTGWAELIASVHYKGLLVSIETEKLEPGSCYIGRVASLTMRSVSIEKVDTECEWGETEKFLFKDITQITFDDGFTNGLALLLAGDA